MGSERRNRFFQLPMVGASVHRSRFLAEMDRSLAGPAAKPFRSDQSQRPHRPFRQRGAAGPTPRTSTLGQHSRLQPAGRQFSGRSQLHEKLVIEPCGFHRYKFPRASCVQQQRRTNFAGLHSAHQRAARRDDLLYSRWHRSSRAGRGRFPGRPSVPLTHRAQRQRACRRTRLRS